MEWSLTSKLIAKQAGCLRADGVEETSVYRWTIELKKWSMEECEWCKVERVYVEGERREECRLIGAYLFVGEAGL